MNCAIIIKDAKFFGHITRRSFQASMWFYNGKNIMKCMRFLRITELCCAVPLICTAADGITVSSEPIIWVKVEQSEMVSSRNVAGMKLMTGCCDFSVECGWLSGYAGSA